MFRSGADSFLAACKSCPVSFESVFKETMNLTVLKPGRPAAFCGNKIVRTTLTTALSQRPGQREYKVLKLVHRSHGRAAVTTASYLSSFETVRPNPSLNR